MSRGTQLSDLIVQLRAEAGHSTLVAAGIDNKPALVQKLNSVQEVLFDSFEWPFKKIRPYISLDTGNRYIDVPANVDIETIRKIVGWWNGFPKTLSKGIGSQELYLFNSDNGERNDPVQKWDIIFTGTTEQIEVWPIVASDNSQQLQLYCLQKLVKMVADADKAFLDDTLIVLFAAAEILARQKDEDAGAVQKRANARYMQLRARYSQMSDTTTMGTEDEAPPVRAPVVITVR